MLAALYAKFDGKPITFEAVEVFYGQLAGFVVHDFVTL